MVSIEDTYILALGSVSKKMKKPDIFAYFQKQGVTIKVISGDHPVTVAAVAQKAGIPDADQVVDASQLKTY